MTDQPRIVTPQEAQTVLDDDDQKRYLYDWQRTYVHTVATEPDRTRAAVVKALRGMADHCRRFGLPDSAEALDDRADAIENGADF